MVAYNTKFNKGCQASNLLARTAYAGKVLGGDHETALNHPLGKNPGDVMVSPNWTKSQLFFLDTRGKIGHGHYKGGVFLGVRSHPFGKNLGDVVSVDEYMKYKGKTQLRQDKNLGGNVGLSEFRDRCREDGIQEGHLLGKNPGDVMTLASETRSKDKLLNQRRRDLAEIRREGRIHWELHPSKDPKWFNAKGKNPGDIVQVNPVRQKSWMSTPGHPFTHRYTGKSRDPSDFWEIRPKPFPGAHFAVYPETLCVAPIKSSCLPGGVVLDPFAGSGTTMKVAIELGRNAIGIELNSKYSGIVKLRVVSLTDNDIIALGKTT